jgi:LPXTG-site transpeptidase (sortase) family protein
MNVNPNGSVQAPLGIYDAGWYTGSVKPGDIGAMFIGAHASGPTQVGLFGKLHTLVVGDTLQVEKGDGARLTYKVVHTEIVDKDDVDMRSMLLPYGNASRALNLMTCAGTWEESAKTLSQRVLVYTEQI